MKIDGGFSEFRDVFCKECGKCDEGQFIEGTYVPPFGDVRVNGLDKSGDNYEVDLNGRDGWMLTCTEVEGKDMFIVDGICNKEEVLLSFKLEM